MSLNESTPNTSERAPDALLSEPRTSRRLVVVLAAQISVPCSTDSRDTQGASGHASDVRRDVIEPTLAENRGTLIRWASGSLLATFESSYNAAHCALVLSNLLWSRKRRVSARYARSCQIGLGLGDVLVQSESISGDAVTIAERLAGLARPGEIYVSGGVYEQISNRLVCKCRSLGEIPLAGMANPIRVYTVTRVQVVGEQRFGLPRMRGFAAAAAAAVVGSVLGLSVMYGAQFATRPAVSVAQAKEVAQVREWVDPQPARARAPNL
jgi:class 3 adenylate cyclase